MELSCSKCGSPDLIKKGVVKNKHSIKQDYKCKDCNGRMLVTITEEVSEDSLLVSKSCEDQTFVITCAVNDTPIHEDFLKSLENYCEINNAQLLIVPVKYHRGKMLEETKLVWPESIQKYLFTENKKLMKGLKLFGGLHVSPAIGNPLSGFDSFSKGDSIIIPHSQLQMRTIAVSHTDAAAIMTTTGAITEPIYTETKQGEKASFNHSYAAVVVEEDIVNGCFHLRHLSASQDGSFYDLKHRYSVDGVESTERIPAIVLGDLHVRNIDPLVKAATFDDNGIIDYLKPEQIIIHDLLDFSSATHHESKNIFARYAKYMAGKNVVEDELHETISFLTNNIPPDSRAVIASSNHDNHLTQWLQESNPKVELHNALLYHELMYLMLKETKMHECGASYPNPLALWAENNYNCHNIYFLSGVDSYKIKGIEVSYHSHKGKNGSRGSAEQFADLGFKTVIGHSHSPKIERGAYQVGHSCYSKLDYTIGSPSSWAHAHCLIHESGKRQLVFVINGSWKRS